VPSPNAELPGATGYDRGPLPWVLYIPAFLSAVAGTNARSVDEYEAAAMVWLCGCGHGSSTVVASLLFVVCYLQMWPSPVVHHVLMCIV
jgi:hypothetical protein